MRGVEAADSEVLHRCCVSQVYRHAWWATPRSSREKVRPCPCCCEKHDRRGDVVQILDGSHRDHGRDHVLDFGWTGCHDGSVRLQW